MSLAPLQVDGNVASLVKLKAFAERTLKPNSTLRRMIMSEPDEMPYGDAIIKAKIYLRMLDLELQN